MCPAELDQPRPPKPQPGPGAKVTTNDAGADWLQALTTWADGIARLFDGARAACPTSATVAP